MQRHATNRFSKNIAFLALAIAAISFTSDVKAQVLDTPTDRLSQQIKVKKPAKSYEIESRIHLAEGTTEGYLVVQVKLKKGCHIYSLTQSGQVPPTKLKVVDSKIFRLKGQFSPDTPAKVTLKDPSFGQRIEKHTGVVQFFAPLEVAAGADLKKLTAEVQFDGQVCTPESCVPVRRHKSKAMFAGFFKRTAANGQQKASSVANKPGDADSTRIK